VVEFVLDWVDERSREFGLLLVLSWKRLKLEREGRRREAFFSGIVSSHQSVAAL
jgi:hypothetical protein